MSIKIIMHILNSISKNLIYSLVVLFVLFVSAFLPLLTAAQGNAGVGIIPAIIDPVEQFQPGESRQFSVKITNISGGDQTYYLSTRDIIGVRDAGVPIFADDSSPKTGFELSEWIALSRSEVQIPAGGQVDVPFQLTIPQDVNPGAHFGSVVVTVDPPTLRTSGAGIGYEVGNIISIRIAGDVLESARIRQFSTSQYVYGSTNVEFSARIENEGNTLVKPTGPLEIVNMFGKRVALLNFNESQAGVFPKTARSDGLRDYQVTWTDESPGFGRYEARLSAVYGSDGKRRTISSTVTFWILPSNIIMPAVIVLSVFLIVLFVSIKLYIRRSVNVASAGLSRRLVRSRKQNQFPFLLLFILTLSVGALFFIILLLLFA
ncbi:MAG TPA: hypothetical protein PKD95_03960 [Candidatus Paceibacterota bacterium]|nr:hypothetical protein [Candidatus Paceibacterota bacterium]